jgi:hypothetical protein
VFAPLDPVSIENSILWNMRSKDVTAEEQTCQSIQSALTEWFHHGKDEYEKHRELLNPFLYALGGKQETRTYEVRLFQYARSFNDQ